MADGITGMATMLSTAIGIIHTTPLPMAAITQAIGTATMPDFTMVAETEAEGLLPMVRATLQTLGATPATGQA